MNGVTAVKNQPPNGVDAIRKASRVSQPGLLVDELKIDERWAAVL